MRIRVKVSMRISIRVTVRVRIGYGQGRVCLFAHSPSQCSVNVSLHIVGDVKGLQHPQLQVPARVGHLVLVPDQVS